MRAKITPNKDGTVNYFRPASIDGMPARTFTLSKEEQSTGYVLTHEVRKAGSVRYFYFFDHTGRCPIYKPDMTTLQMARAFREREMDYLRALKNDNKD